MIQNESSLEILKPINEVFAFIDDNSKASSWLESCIELTQISTEQKTSGTRLHYVYNQGGRNRAMDGIVTGYMKDTQLVMKFSDSQFEIQIGFSLTLANNGTLVTHSIVITPKGLFGKMMSRVIGAGNQKQIQNNLVRLKKLLEQKY